MTSVTSKLRRTAATAGMVLLITGAGAGIVGLEYERGPVMHSCPTDSSAPIPSIGCGDAHWAHAFGYRWSK